MKRDRGAPLSLSPKDYASRVIALWWWWTLAGFLGGLLGLGFAGMIPPLYESSAILGISVDFTILPPPGLIVEDRILSRVSGLLQSTPTLQQVERRIRQDGWEDVPWDDLSTFRDHVRLDAKLSDWHLVGIATDPDLSAEIANAWAQVALLELAKARDHALEAVRMHEEASGASCGGLIRADLGRKFWDCLTAAAGLDEAGAKRLRDEIRLSHGILPVISFELLQNADAPETPVVWQRSVLATSGALLGTLAGLLAVGMTSRPGRTSSASRRKAKA